MATQRSKSKKTREAHQRKKAQKGVKSQRGVPELYDELKKPASVSATPTGRKGFDEKAKSMGLSRSELFEKIGRNEVEVIFRDLSA